MNIKGELYNMTDEESSIQYYSTLRGSDRRTLYIVGPIIGECQNMNDGRRLEKQEATKMQP